MECILWQKNQTILQVHEKKKKKKNTSVKELGRKHANINDFGNE